MGGAPPSAATDSWLLLAVPPSTALKQQPTKPAPLPVWYIYYPRQYGGLLLGSLACLGSVYGYRQTVDGSTLMVWQLVAWMLLASVGLAIHETRPFKVRRGECFSYSAEGCLPAWQMWVRSLIACCLSAGTEDDLRRLGSGAGAKLDLDVFLVPQHSAD